MDRRQLMAGAAIVGGAGLTLVGLGLTVVTADAAPPIVSNEPDPSGPTFTIEPAPSAPSTDISSGTGITSSTDTGSVMPDVTVPDLTVGAPSDMPPILDVPSGPPPIEGTTGAADMPAPNTPGAQPNPTPGDPIGIPEDLGHGCRPLWCPRPPNGPSEPPTRAWNGSVLAGHVRLVGLHDGRPAVAVRSAATTGCSASPAVAVRRPDGLPGVRRRHAAVGLLVFRQLGPAVRRRMPDASSSPKCRATHLGANSMTARAECERLS